ncbi:MAG: hypothetical protein AAGD07_14140 [Planctomycetota bacterium]
MRRNQIEAKLAGGTVDLFGMPVAGRSDNAFEDLRKWVDLALKYNPRTTFLIGQYWPPGGPRMDVTKYATANEAVTRKSFEVLARLRKAYPNRHFYFVDYGKVAAEMKSQFVAGKLTDIKEPVGRSAKSLFRGKGKGTRILFGREHPLAVVHLLKIVTPGSATEPTGDGARMTEASCRHA